MIEKFNAAKLSTYIHISCFSEFCSRRIGGRCNSNCECTFRVAYVGGNIRVTGDLAREKISAVSYLTSKTSTNFVIRYVDTHINDNRNDGTISGLIDLGFVYGYEAG